MEFLERMSDQAECYFVDLYVRMSNDLATGMYEVGLAGFLHRDRATWPAVGSERAGLTFCSVARRRTWTIRCIGESSTTMAEVCSRQKMRLVGPKAYLKTTA